LNRDHIQTGWLNRPVFVDGKGENMVWFMVLQIVSTLIELIQFRRTSVSDKEMESLLLRRQLAIYERRQRQPMRLTRGEKLTLVVLAVRLKAKNRSYDQTARGGDSYSETQDGVRLAS
jgi:hypothetical protein